MTYTAVIPISGWSQQVIFGTVLGGSSLVKQKNSKNCFLSMRGKNINWLHYKANEMQLLSAPHPLFEDKATIRWHSTCTPALNEIYDYFYKDGKRQVNDFVLDKLRDIGLMVWFMDSGGIKGKCAFFRTTRYGDEGSEVINQYFKLLGMESHVSNYRGKRVFLDEPSTIRLLKVIAPVAPKFMYSSLVL